MSFGDYGPRGQRIFLWLLVGFPWILFYPEYGADVFLGVVIALLGIAYQVGRVVEREYIEDHKWDPDSDVWKQQSKSD